jgi:hypothetical protein
MSNGQGSKKKKLQDTRDFHVLYTFAKRMEDLRAKQYFKHLQEVVDFNQTPSSWEKIAVPTQSGQKHVPISSVVDEELLISFLATLRQFLMNDEAIFLNKIKGIVRRKAEILEGKGVPGLVIEMKRLKEKHKWHEGVKFRIDLTDNVGHIVQPLTREELLDLFLYGKYFHSTDVIGVRFHFELPKECVDFCRALLEYNLRYEVAELLDWYQLVVHILNEGLVTPTDPLTLPRSFEHP